MTRRERREATVQLLYTLDEAHSGNLNEGCLAEEGLGPVFRLIFHHLGDRLVRVRCKALVHLQQQRAQQVQKLEGVATPELANLLDTFVPPGVGGGARAKPSVELKQAMRAERELLGLLDSLRRCVRSGGEADDLQSGLDALSEMALGQGRRLRRLSDYVAGYSGPEGSLGRLQHILTKLGRYQQHLLDSLSSNPPEGADYQAVHRTRAELEMSTRSIRELALLVVGNLAGTDARIQDALDHYQLERLDRVDLAILRLAATELLHCPDVPRPVAINEALEIARRYSSAKSARFINGVLDQIKPARQSPSRSS